MNEILKKTLPYIIPFLIGAVVFGGGSGFWVHRSANNKLTNLKEQIDSLGRTNQEIGKLNGELKDAVARDAEIKRQLGNTIKKQRADLERANSFLEEAGESNQLASDYNQQAIEYIDGLISRYREDGSETSDLEDGGDS